MLAGCLLAACGQAEESGWQTVTVTPQAADEKPQKAADSSQTQQGALQAEGSQVDGVQEFDSAQEGSGKKSDDAQTDGPQAADVQGDGGSIRKKLIEEQTFQLNLVPYGQVTFASYEPDTGTEPNADATFAVLKDAKTVYTFPAVHEGNVYSGNAFYAVEAVSFPDINQDGYDDVIIICQYIRGAGPQSGEVFSEARIYLGSAEGSFTVEKKLMEDANSALSEVTVESVKGFLGIGVKTPENGAGMQAWQQALIGQIQKDMVSEAYCGYDLIWLDGDNIPELVEIGDCEATGCRIVSFYDGEITVTQLNRLYFSYLEKEGLLCNSEGNMDYYYDLVYRLAGGEMELIAQGYYGAEDNSNVQFDEAGEPIYQYEWEGKKMSKEEYARELEAVYDTERAKSYAWPGASAQEVIDRLTHME